MRCRFLCILAVVSATLVNACDHTPTQPSCTYSTSATPQQFEAAGGSGTLTVNTQARCSWTAQSGADWVTLGASKSGSGSGSVSFTVAQNAVSTDRSAALAIAGQTVTIRQLARTCEFHVSPDTDSYPADGGRGSIRVEAIAGCQWRAASTVEWLRVISGATGIGPGTVEYELASHDGFDDRTGTLNVAGQLVTIHQDGRDQPPSCDYSVGPVSFTYHWHGTDGQTPEIRIATGPVCPWTAAADVPWLIIRTASAGTGSGSVAFSVASYTAQPTRHAPIMIRWPTETAGQNVWITQDGCGYALGARERAFGREGGRGEVTVIASPMSVDCMIGCPWTASVDANWIHISTPMPNAGDGRLVFLVDQNSSGLDRSATILAAGITLAITQLGR